MTRFLRAGSIAILAASFLTACLPDVGGDSGTAGADTSANSAPTISGSAATSIAVGSNFVFTPTASDADGDTLTFSISGQPTGSTFDTSTGRLSWTPGAPGSFASIVISVSDNQGGVASLAAFTLTVTGATATASLRWQAPTLNTDGSALVNSELAGYRVYHGKSQDQLKRIAELDAATTAFVVNALEQGTHYFAVTAFSTAGTESGYSAVGSKTVL